MNRIICGDSIEEMRNLPEESVDIIITSPPYNLKNSTGNGLKDGRGGKWSNAKLMNGYSNHNDNMSVEDCNELMGFLTPLVLNGDLEWDGSFVNWGMERLQWVINNNYVIDELQNHLLAGGTI